MLETGERAGQDGVRMVMWGLHVPLLTHRAPCAAVSAAHVDGIRPWLPGAWDVGMASLGSPVGVPGQDCILPSVPVTFLWSSVNMSLGMTSRCINKRMKVTGRLGTGRGLNEEMGQI